MVKKEEGAICAFKIISPNKMTNIFTSKSPPLPLNVKKAEKTARGFKFFYFDMIIIFKMFIPGPSKPPPPTLNVEKFQKTKEKLKFLMKTSDIASCFFKSLGLSF